MTRDPIASILFREEFLYRLGKIVDKGLAMHDHSTKAQLSRRYELLRRAEDVIEEHLTRRSISTQDLAMALGVSPRVLQYAFKDVIGNSPYEYILKRKLHAVRRELCRQRRHGAIVSQVALAYGFGELGRFAGRYTQLFGELPSATLHQALK